MNDYEAKQEARKERLENAAEKLEAKAGAVLNVGREHYSRDWAFVTQPGHIPARAQWIKKQERAFEDTRQAADLRAKAASVGRGGVSSDDPEAVIKLREKLAKLEKKQDAMKRANAIIRKHKAQESAVPELIALGLSEANAREALKPDFCGRIGFPNYELTNNNGNMRRIKQRIEALTKQAATVDQDDREHDCGVYRVVECFADNRLRVYFDGKPPESVRSILKRNGFRWSPDAGAWQRMLSGGIVEWLTREDDGGYLRKQLTEAAT